MRLMPYIEGSDTRQSTFLSDCLDDLISHENPVRVIEAFVDSINLDVHGFTRATLAATGRPAYNPAHLLKLYIYGYIHKIRSFRKLEQETRRNIELWWLLERLTPDHNTIADFRKDSGKCSGRLYTCARSYGLSRGNANARRRKPSSLQHPNSDGYPTPSGHGI